MLSRQSNNHLYQPPPGHIHRIQHSPRQLLPHLTYQRNAPDTAWPVSSRSPQPPPHRIDRAATGAWLNGALPAQAKDEGHKRQ